MAVAIAAASPCRARNSVECWQFDLRRLRYLEYLRVRVCMCTPVVIISVAAAIRATVHATDTPGFTKNLGGCCRL